MALLRGTQRLGGAFFGAAPRGKRSGIPVGFHVVFGIGGLLVLLVTSILVAVFLVARIKGEAAQLSGRDVPFARHVAEAALSAKGIANDERGFLLTGDLEFVYEADERISEARSALAAAGSAAATNDQRQTITAARRGFERWIQAIRTEFETFHTGDRTAIISASLGPVRNLRKTYEHWLERAQDLATSATEAAQTSVAAVSSRTVSVLLVCLICVLTLGVGIALWLIRSILKPVYLLLAILEEGDQTKTSA